MSNVTDMGAMFYGCIISINH
ncbi:hypothetical protein K4E85_09940 (plasmid) [Campylobacter coli]